MDSLAWAAVGAGAGAVMCSLGFATFWMNMQRQITEAKTEANAAGLRGVQANLKIDGIVTDRPDLVREEMKRRDMPVPTGTDVTP